MKKMMIASAVLFSVLAAKSDVASQNVVGFMDTELRQGNLMTSAVFSKITLNKEITIDQIQVKGYTPYNPKDSKSGTFKQVQIKVLDASGDNAKEPFDPTLERVYYYIDNEDTGPDGYNGGAGWYRTNAKKANKVTDIKFSMGDGLWIQGQDGLSITIAGEVNTADLTIPLRQGNTPCGNPYAVALPITNIAVTGYTPYNPKDSKSGTFKQVQIKVLDASGDNAKEPFDPTLERVYYYIDNEDTGPDGYNGGAGWYRTNAKKANKVTTIEFLPGEGLWVQGQDGLSLEIKSPINLSK